MILAIDSTTDRLTVAVRGDAGRVVERTLVGARRHAGSMASLALEALGELGATPSALTGLAIADGPGSFTGLRVGAAFVKGVARARSVPVWTASTLAIRAWAARPVSGTRVVAGVGSALRGELYVGVYRVGGLDAEVGAIHEPLLAPVVVRPGAPLPSAPMPDAIVGDVAEEELRRWPWGSAALVIGPPEGLPSAASLIEMVAAGVAVRPADVGLWEPVYGRPAEAQARWERLHGRQLDPTHTA